LLGVACTLRDFDAIDRLGEEGWVAMQAAMPTLIASEDDARMESGASLGIAFALVEQQARSGIIGSGASMTTVGGESADLIFGWLLRSDAPFRRIKLFNSGPPTGTEPVRARWRSAAASGDPSTIGAFLRDNQEIAAKWLCDSEPPAAVKESLPSAVTAIAAWPTARGFLCAVVEPGRKHATIQIINAQLPQVREDDLAQLARDAETWEAFRSFIQSVHDHVASPLVQSLTRAPTRLRWSPHGWLRLIPSAALFPGLQVEWTSSLAVLDAPRRASNRSGALVIVADPGRGAGAMGSQALEAATRLKDVSAPSRLVVGRHTAFGHELVPGAADVRPTAFEIVRELANAEVAVVLAHGHADSLRDAWIECLDEMGRPDRLDSLVIASWPGAVAGATIILLSCEMGRTGEAAVAPGGIAGALLAGGASQVVAPLWPVSLRGAVAVALELVSKPRGTDVSAALATASSLGGNATVSLGRPQGTAAAQFGRDRLAFVTWVG
jgi:hypothetical protein